MKRALVFAVVVAGVALAGAQAFATQIVTPTSPTPVLTGITFGGGNAQNSDSTVRSEIAAYIGVPNVNPYLLYKATPGAAEEGSLAGSYQTTFSGDASGGTIHYTGGPFVDTTGGADPSDRKNRAYLLIKDGNNTPWWYLYDLTASDWDGKEDLSLAGFWPANGSISHAAIYGHAGINTVPEPGTMLLLGSGLFGLAGAARRRMKK